MRARARARRAEGCRRWFVRTCLPSFFGRRLRAHAGRVGAPSALMLVLGFAFWSCFRECGTSARAADGDGVHVAAARAEQTIVARKSPSKVASRIAAARCSAPPVAAAGVGVRSGQQLPQPATLSRAHRSTERSLNGWSLNGWSLPRRSSVAFLLPLFHRVIASAPCRAHRRGRACRPARSGAAGDVSGDRDGGRACVSSLHASLSLPPARPIATRSGGARIRSGKIKYRCRRIGQLGAGRRRHGDQPASAWLSLAAGAVVSAAIRCSVQVHG